VNQTNHIDTTATHMDTRIRLRQRAMSSPDWGKTDFLSLKKQQVSIWPIIPIARKIKDPIASTIKSYRKLSGVTVIPDAGPLGQYTLTHERKGHDAKFPHNLVNNEIDNSKLRQMPYL